MHKGHLNNSPLSRPVHTLTNQVAPSQHLYCWAADWGQVDTEKCVAAEFNRESEYTENTHTQGMLRAFKSLYVSVLGSPMSDKTHFFCPFEVSRSFLGIPPQQQVLAIVERKKLPFNS